MQPSRAEALMANSTETRGPITRLGTENNHQTYFSNIYMLTTKNKEEREKTDLASHLSISHGGASESENSDSEAPPGTIYMAKCIYDDTTKLWSKRRQFALPHIKKMVAR